MISFTLKCDADHSFEGWFRSNDDFSFQRDSGLLECPICGSKQVFKSLMAPAVTGTKMTRDAVESARQSEFMATASADAATGGNSTHGGEVAPTAHVPPRIRNDPRVREVLNTLRELRKRVTAEADYVGADFAEEARKIHFGEADLRAIYGEATVDEAKDLLEEGIDIAPLPILPEDRN